ncbi:MAG: cellulase family glycosylhydrolase, partial [Patescibacteria group bacterium]
MKKLIVFIFTISLFLPWPARAAPLDDLRSDLDQWLSSDAAGFLVWQYSGPKDKYFENDPYSFYQGSPVCSTLKQAATKYPDKFIGVNIHSLANHPTQIDDTFSYLSKECGVSVVRVWGTPDRGDPKLVLDSAKKYGVKIIVVLADYSNSSGDILPGPIRANPTAWYTAGYRDVYLPYIISVVNSLKSHPALFAYELANEPHCSGIDACRGPYKNWANNVAQEIKRNDHTVKVGIGQKSSENSTLGDSPGNGDFRNSNDSSYINITSAHYYTPSEKSLASQAQDQSNQLGKPFYLGEVGYQFDEIPTGSSLPAKKGPLEEGFNPLKYYPCDGNPADPEYHPLRPYPGSPCDPLIPKSIPEAPQTSEKKFNTFACGTSLTPSTIERFDAYGQNGYYENLPTTYGYAHTICDPVPEDSPNGTTANCWRSEVFDVTLDLSKANLGILGNTQDVTLSDAQKINEYLSWYLTGTPQIGDQIPLQAKNPADINRLVNFSGPLRKLLPADLQNIGRK